VAGRVRQAGLVAPAGNARAIKVELEVLGEMTLPPPPEFLALAVYPHRAFRVRPRRIRRARVDSGLGQARLVDARSVFGDPGHRADSFVPASAPAPGVASFLTSRPGRGPLDCPRFLSIPVGPYGPPRLLSEGEGQAGAWQTPGRPSERKGRRPDARRGDFGLPALALRNRRRTGPCGLCRPDRPAPLPDWGWSPALKVGLPRPVVVPTGELCGQPPDPKSGPNRPQEQAPLRAS